MEDDLMTHHKASVGKVINFRLKENESHGRKGRS